MFQKDDESISIVDGNSVTSEEMNYKKMFLDGEECRKQREKTGNAAQRKQAEQVNKDRTLFFIGDPLWF